jgi:hypothetical protein
VVAFDDGKIHRQRLSSRAQIAPKQERFGLVISPDFKNSCARLEQHSVLMGDISRDGRDLEIAQNGGDGHTVAEQFTPVLHKTVSVEDRTVLSACNLS